MVKMHLINNTKDNVEYLNLYDKNGKLLKEKGIRGQKTDYYMGISIIYIENSKREFLIQKTSSNRGNIYATTGGHVDYGWTFEDTIIKEVKEELGISINKEEIEEKCTCVWNHYFQKIYYLKKDIDIKDIIIQKEEVQFVKWLNKDEIDNLIKNNQFREGNIAGYKYVIGNK